jgi:hypothetical protein
LSKDFLRENSSDSPLPSITIPGRQLDDAGTIRALAHPTRLTLLQLLLVRGPLTATEAGGVLGESPASASFHLRTLARYGYVEVVDAGAGSGDAPADRVSATPGRVPTA